MLIENQEYEISKIRKCKIIKNKVHYSVEWADGDESVEPEGNMNGCPPTLSQYLTGYTNQKTLIYCRVSSKTQTNYYEGHTSLEVQENTCRNYAKKT